MRGGVAFLYRQLAAFMAVFVVVQGTGGLSAMAQPPVTPIAAAGTCGAGAGGGSIGSVIDCVIVSTQQSHGLLSGLCYLFGLVIGLWAIAKFYEHVQNPHQVQVWEGIKKTIVAGGLFAMPMVMEAAYNTLHGGPGAVGLIIGNWAGAPTGGGLDAMVVALMNNTFLPMKLVILLFCNLAGIILLMVGVLRLMKSAQEGPRGPGGFGTIMTFLVAGALLSVGEMMNNFTFSLFQDNVVDTNAVLTFNAGLQAAEQQHILSVISAILAFVMVLGWISFVRGWFIIRNVAEGDNQASLMAGMTHLLGGTLAINLGPVLNAVQTTFGLSAIGVNFTP